LPWCIAAAVLVHGLYLREEPTALGILKDVEKTRRRVYV
jgi:hypothetical protein